MASPPTQSGRVAFHPSVQFKGETTRRHHPTIAPESTTKIFREFESKDVTDDMLDDAARLFSEHYGIWDTPDGCRGGKRGIILCHERDSTPRGLPPQGVPCVYVSLHTDDALAGHLLACRWIYQGRQVCWVTQLVVHHRWRERRIATRLLEKLRKKDDDIFGIMSSHPAALIAMAKACADFPFPQVPTSFMETHASGVMASSPIAYIKDAKLCGSLFQPGTASDTSLVSGADTNFFVNHDEPLKALRWLEKEGVWTLGDVPDRREFLLVFDTPRRRSRSLSRHMYM
ncbi:hypothetical protein B0T16DRAFT_315221 [Cercophora newfieldiana]|uniref:N-acetyltransferase domain-containing protein n=1 Tax=Cercophora newfieldiana TaxID=92897 RepID=A0AA39YP81_9PEZI|nr:hypothetical protein B0T16DRAFT_315221 [Cercophora newfieldiana]